MEESLQVGDIGVQLEYQLLNPDGTLFNLSGATLIQLIYGRPLPNANLIVTPSFVTDGTDGLIKYNTVLGDLNVQGNWKVQVYIEIDGKKFHSNVDSFYVHPNL